MLSFPNFANRTMWTRDNLDVLRGLNSESIDFVYADPPTPAGKAVPETRHRLAMNAVSNTPEEHAVDVLSRLAAEVADDPRVSGGFPGLRPKRAVREAVLERNREGRTP